MAQWTLNGPERELWTVRDVCQHFGWGKTKFYALIKAGLFPAGRDMGGRQTWTGEDVAAYLLLAGRWRPEGVKDVKEGEGEG